MNPTRNQFVIAASAAILAFAAPGLAAPQKAKAAAHNSGGGGGKASAAKASSAKSGPTQAKRSSAQSSVNPTHGKGGSKGGGNTVNVKKGGGNDVTVNRNTNVNVSNNNRNDRRYGAPPPGYRAGGYYSGGHYYYDDDDGLGFVGKVAVASTAALIVGAILTDKPDDCEESIHYGQPYLYCNGTWYQPTQSGSNTTYVVVNKP
jgi:hypothetical protein